MKAKSGTIIFRRVIAAPAACPFQLQRSFFVCPFCLRGPARAVAEFAAVQQHSHLKPSHCGGATAAGEMQPGRCSAPRHAVASSFAGVLGDRDIVNRDRSYRAVPKLCFALTPHDHITAIVAERWRRLSSTVGAQQRGARCHAAAPARGLQRHLLGPPRLHLCPRTPCQDQLRSWPTGTLTAGKRLAATFLWGVEETARWRLTSRRSHLP